MIKLGERICRTCSASHLSHSGERECRLNPPITQFVALPGPQGPDMRQLTAFPKVSDDWACGGYKALLRALNIPTAKEH